MSKGMATVSYRQLLSVAEFPRLTLVSLLARLANAMLQGALVLFILEKFRSPQLAGLTILLASAPGLFVSPVAGVLLDRIGRTKLILFDYAFAGLLLGLMIWLSLSGVLTPWFLLPLVTLGSLTRPLSSTGTRALLPTIVPQHLWDRANAIDSGEEELANVIGPSLSGIFVGLLGGQNTLLIIALMFGLASITLIGMKEIPPKTSGQIGTVVRDSLHAVVYVFKHQTLRGLVLTFLAGNTGYGIFVIGLPVLILARFGNNTFIVGAAWAVMGVASILSVFLMGFIGTEKKERVAITVGMLLFALGTVIVILANTLVVLFVGIVVIGLHGGPISVSVSSLRQRRTPAAWMGRALSISLSLNAVGMPLGAAISGPIIAYSTPVALVLTALLCVVAGLVVLVVVPKEDGAKENI